MEDSFSDIESSPPKEYYCVKRFFIHDFIYSAIFWSPNSSIMYFRKKYSWKLFHL